LKTVVQHILISHHGQYEFGSPKLPMIREALVFHYMDDMDSKLAAVRSALASESGDPEWSAYSGALGRKFLRLDAFLNPKPQSVKLVESNVGTHAVESKPDEAKSDGAKSGVAKLGDLFNKH